MAFSITSFIKGILIKEENTSSPKAIQITPGGNANTTTTVTSSQTANRTLTLPDATDTVVGRATTDTLTNKSINGSTNTITNVSLTTGVIGTLPIANGGTNSTTTLNNNRVMRSSGGAITEAAAITANRAVISDANGIPTHSTVTDTEIGYVSGVTSAIQTQLDNKATSINFITNGFAEVNTNGWAAYADAAGTSPVDGTGGSPTVTITRSTSSPLTGAASFLITKDAANRQGQGVSYDFTIDNASKSKVLQISFDSIVNSGTFVAGSSSADSDITVWIYDITNARLIQPTTYKIFGSSSTTADKFISNFQSSADSTSYRLIFHCATTSASAYVLKIDNVNVSATTISYGTPITDWIDGGAITITATTTNPTKGTTTRDKVYWRRVGNILEAFYQYAQSGAGSAGSGDYLFAIPGNISVDINLQPSFSGTFTSGGAVNAGNEALIGHGTIGDSSGSRGNLTCFLYDSTKFRIAEEIVHTQYGVWGSSAYPLSTAKSAGFWIRVPIQGWSAQVQSSDVNDQRIVAVKVSGNPSVSGGIIVFPTKDFDTHSGYNTSTGRYTVPISGLYRISAFIYGNAAQIINRVYVNGVADTGAIFMTSSTDFVGTGSITVSARAGDLIDLRGTSGFLTSGNSHMEIERIANPASITSTETIAARYKATAAKSVSTTQPIDFDTKVEDTHNAVTTGSSWKFTAPTAGLYRVSASGMASNVSPAIRVYKNGTFYANGSIWIGSLVNWVASVNCLVRLNAGDFVDIRSSNAITTDNIAESTYVDIERVGI